MKKYFSVLSLSLIFALSACGGKGSSQDTGDDDGGTMVATPVMNHGKDAGNKFCKPGQTDGIIGVYNGYVTKQNGIIVPLALTVASRQGSSGTGTPLRASLRVGVLGGVTVGTDDVAYDSTGNFTATFANASSSGGNSAELFGSVQCGQFITATIRGKNTYSNIVLGTQIPSLYDSRTQFDYNMTLSTKGSARGEVSFISKLTATPSNQTSDLPLLPDVQTSLTYDGLGMTPAMADTTVYQALEGYLEVGFIGYGEMEFHSVGLKNMTGDTQAPTLTGKFAVGSKIVSTVVLTPTKSTSHAMPTWFKGTFTGSNGVSTPVVANFVYEQKLGKNPPDSLLPTFPQLNLQVQLCGIARQTFELASVNVLTSTADFTYTKAATGEVYEYDAKYTSGWRSLSGRILGTLKNRKNRYSLTLVATPGNTIAACSP